jgi:hypothetical protein
MSKRHSVIVFGPQGCGKTRNTARLMEHFGLNDAIELDDQPVGYSAPRIGVLLLSSKTVLELKRYDLALVPFDRVEALLP